HMKDKGSKAKGQSKPAQSRNIRRARSVYLFAFLLFPFAFFLSYNAAVKAQAGEVRQMFF
ncbi:MAG TPA: hypothetical protein VGO91_12380, partial [Pyrinomonadaceae bacterium]|nr:hypothetical protein [Pyrinomonadaceae bacterium]